MKNFGSFFFLKTWFLKKEVRFWKLLVQNRQLKQLKI